MKNLRAHHIVSFLAAGGIAIAALNFNSATGEPLFSSLDNFVLFASEEVKLEQEVQVSSGDIGSNSQTDIQKDAIINGNLFADKITLDKNTIINGNVSFNKLKTQKETQIFGTQTKPIQLPIANLPGIPDFSTGTQDFNFTGAANTLAAGNYRDIVLEKDGRLVLSGGVYNLDKLELKENSTVIFATTTVLNIKSELKVQQKISILPGQNTKFDDLRINFQDKKPIEFGKNSFLNFKLLAPKADVHVEEETTLRGQILARKIKIEKDGILSKKEFFSKNADVNKVIGDPGARFIVNEVVIRMSEGATLGDIQQIIGVVNGRITGFLDKLRITKIEIPVTTVLELNQAVNTLRSLNSPFIQDVMINFIFK